MTTWNEITSNPRWEYLTPDKRNAIRMRFVANELLPYAKSKGLNADEATRNFLARTYSDLGIVLPKAPGGLKAGQTNSWDAQFHDKMPVVDDFIRGWVNEATFGYFKPILYDGVAPPKGAAEAIATGLGSLGGFIVGAGGGRAPATLAKALTNMVEKKVVAKFGEKVVANKIGQLLTRAGSNAVGLGATFAAMSPDESKQMFVGMASSDKSIGNAVADDVLSRAKQFGQGASMGAGFGAASAIPNAAARVATSAAVGGLPSTIAQSPAPEQVFNYALGGFFGLKGQPLPETPARFKAPDLSVQGERPAFKGNTEPVNLPRNAGEIRLNIAAMNEQARRQGHEETLPPPLDVNNPTPTSRKLEQITPQQNLTRPRADVTLGPELKLPQTAGEILATQSGREAQQRLTGEDPYNPPNQAIETPQRILPSDISGRPPIPSEGSLQSQVTLGPEIKPGEINPAEVPVSQETPDLAKPAPEAKPARGTEAAPVATFQVGDKVMYRGKERKITSLNSYGTATLNDPGKSKVPVKLLQSGKVAKTPISTTNADIPVGSTGGIQTPQDIAGRGDVTLYSNPLGEVVKGVKSLGREGGFLDELNKEMNRSKGESVIPISQIPESQRTGSQKFEAMLEKQRQDVKAKQTVTGEQRVRKLQRAWTDSFAAVKAELRNLGQQGEEAIMRLNSTKHSTAEGERLSQEQWNNITGGEKWTPEERDRLGSYLQAERTVELDDRITTFGKELDDAILNQRGEKAIADIKARLKKAQSLKHSADAGGDVASDWIKYRESEWGANETMKIREAANRFHEAMRSNLDALLKDGLLSQEQYDNLSQYAKYAPRKFIQHVDFDGERMVSYQGKTRSVTDSGIPKLDEGSIQALVNNPQYLLWQSTIRTNSRIWNNRAAKSLLDIARDQPGNPIVEAAKVDGKGNPVPGLHSGKIPSGKVQISAVENGQRYDMYMPEELGNEWIGQPKEVSQRVANMVGWITGTKPLKAMATGYNPEFAFANLARDIAHIYLTIAGQTQYGKTVYSSFTPQYVFQMMGDMGSVFHDAITRGGRYRDFVREGGGMEFMTHQGRLFKLGGGDIATHETLGKIQNVLGWMGETSEILTRLAVRERALKSGLTAEQATAVARDYLDFSQGGSLSKALDMGIPYLNASIQGTRRLGWAAMNNPKVFAWKLAQLGALAYGLYYANRKINPEAWAQISDSDKDNNWIITIPIYRMDDQGQKIYRYFKIPKDQSQRLWAGVFEAMGELATDGKLPTLRLMDRINSMAPANIDAVTPTVEMVLAYLGNEDWWTKEPIWRGERVKPELEYTDKTPESFKQLGAALGISPERTRVALSKIGTNYNIYEDIVGAGYAATQSLLTGQDALKLNELVMNNVPFARRFTKETNPNSKKYDDLERLTVEENSRRVTQNRQLDDAYKSGDIGAARKVIKGASQEDKDRLTNRLKRLQSVKDIPTFWLNLAEKAPRTRALYYYQEWVKADEPTRSAMDKLSRKVPGFRSPDFNKIFNQFRVKGTTQ